MDLAGGTCHRGSGVNQYEVRPRFLADYTSPCGDVDGTETEREDAWSFANLDVDVVGGKATIEKSDLEAARVLSRCGGGDKQHECGENMSVAWLVPCRRRVHCKPHEHISINLIRTVTVKK